MITAITDLQLVYLVWSAAVREVRSVAASRAPHAGHQVQLGGRARSRQVLRCVVPGHAPAATKAAHQHGTERRAVYGIERQRPVVRRLHVGRQVVLRRGGRRRTLRLRRRLLAFLFHLEEKTGLYEPLDTNCYVVCTEIT